MALGKFFKWVKNAANKVKDGVVKGFNAVKNFVKDKAPGIIDTAGKVFKAAGDISQKFVDPNSKFGQAINTGINIGQNVTNKAGQYVDKANQIFQQIPNV